MSTKLKFSRYDYAAFLAFAAYAMGSLIIPLCLVSIANDLGFPLDGGGMGQGGAIQAIRGSAMTATLLTCGVLAARYGNRKPLAVASMTMALGVAAAALAPSYAMLVAAVAVAGIGEGVIEGLATPFVNELHPEEPGRYVNFAHSFWSVGILVATLPGGLLLHYHVDWRVLLLVVAMCGVIPGILLFMRPPKGVVISRQEAEPMPGGLWANLRELFGNPRMYIYILAIMLAGSGEFGTTFWCASFIQLAAGANAFMGGLGTACFAMGMLASRMGSGMFLKENQMFKMLVTVSALSLAVSIIIPHVYSLPALLAMFALAGFGMGPLWPTIQTRCVERIGGSSTLIYIILSGFGILGSGGFSMVLGWLGDEFGLRRAFSSTPVCFLLMLILLVSDRGKPARAQG